MTILGFSLLFIIEVVGLLLIIGAFKQMTLIKVHRKENNLRWLLLHLFFFITSLTIGCIFTLFSIFIPAVQGIDMDIVLFILIGLILYKTYQVVFIKTPQSSLG